MKKISIKKGFSLIEVMISITLTISVLAMVTQFLFNFTNMSTMDGKKSEIQAELRTVNLRLEKELELGCAVLDSYNSTDLEYGSGTFTSNSNRVIFTRPVYHKTTQMPAYMEIISSAGFPQKDTGKNDVVIIEYTGNDGSSNIKKGNILYSIIPATNVSSDYDKSQKIIKRKLNSDIINSLDDNVFTAYKIFSYFSSSQEVTSGTLGKVSLIKINLQSRKEYGSKSVRDSLKNGVYLRNFINL